MVTLPAVADRPTLALCKLTIACVLVVPARLEHANAIEQITGPIKIIRWMALVGIDFLVFIAVAFVSGKVVQGSTFIF